MVPIFLPRIESERSVSGIDVGDLRIADHDVDERLVGAHVLRLADRDRDHGGAAWLPPICARPLRHASPCRPARRRSRCARAAATAAARRTSRASIRASLAHGGARGPVRRRVPRHPRDVCHSLVVLHMRTPRPCSRLNSAPGSPACARRTASSHPPRAPCPCASTRHAVFLLRLAAASIDDGGERCRCRRRPRRRPRDR